ncbi:SH3 domain-containing protein 21 isoform X1 [Odocoileus virginianus]|uniref:SH3 domain-containing protein 21 isoform X1 n=1 Tax=Odocoileus virginianus TaxID=9874 RepID=A0ABM4I9K1_ODOVR
MGLRLRLLGFTISRLVPPYLDPVLGCQRYHTILPCSAPEGASEAMEVLVLAGYRAQKEDELSLAPGDVIRQEIPETLRCSGETPRPRCARRRGRSVKFLGPRRWCKANFNYTPEQADELQLQAGEIVEVIKEIEDGWWLGKKNGQLGAFPSNFVELLDSGPPSLGNRDIPSIILGPQRPQKLSSLTYDSPPDYLQTVSYPETYRVMFDYHPEAPDELALRRGDEVKVLRKVTEDKGWWEGESQGRRGLFPDNFVLPPPPVKKLVPRKVVSQESASVKEPKKMMPKTVLPTVKKLMTAPSEPSKTKPSWTPSGDSQKRPSRNSSSNSSFQPGRKRSKTQASQQRPAASQDEKQRRLTKGPRVNTTPILNKTTSPEKTPTLDRAPRPEKTPPPDKTPSPEKTLSPDKSPNSEKTPPPVKTPSPEKTLSPDKSPNPEKTPPSEKNPTPEETLIPEKVPTLEETPTLEDNTPSPDRALSGHEAQVPEVLLEDEAFGPKMAPPGDEAPTLRKVLTPEPVLSEEASAGDNSQFHHFSPEEDPPPNARSLEASEAQSQEEVHTPEEPSLGLVKQPLERRASSPLQSKSNAKSGSAPALEKGPPQEELTTLPEEAPPKAETTLKEQESPKEGVPSKEVTPAQQNAEPQTPPTLHSSVPPNLTDRRSDGDDMLRIKDQVEALRRSLEQMGVQLEKKLMDISEELKSEREKRLLLEVQMKQRTRDFIHAQTQTH